MLQKFQAVAVFTSAVFLSVCHRSCYSCQNDFKSFQKILKMRQQIGKIRRRLGMEISSQYVVSKLACLDACLRTTRCASLDLKKTPPNHIGQGLWLCVINRQGRKTQGLIAQESGWKHVNVSSQELLEVRQLLWFVSNKHEL